MRYIQCQHRDKYKKRKKKCELKKKNCHPRTQLKSVKRAEKRFGCNFSCGNILILAEAAVVGVRKIRQDCENHHIPTQDTSIALLHSWGFLNQKQFIAKSCWRRKSCARKFFWSWAFHHLWKIPPIYSLTGAQADRLLVHTYSIVHHTNVASRWQKVPSRSDREQKQARSYVAKDAHSVRAALSSSVFSKNL